MHRIPLFFSTSKLMYAVVSTLATLLKCLWQLLSFGRKRSPHPFLWLTFLASNHFDSAEVRLDWIRLDSIPVDLT